MVLELNTLKTINNLLFQRHSLNYPSYVSTSYQVGLLTEPVIILSFTTELKTSQYSRKPL
jgi:hypothetical protein